ncbi:alpha-amylase family glycosyl hydrolase [Gloeobacter kilaueensis]|uniref:Alpha-amylase n=1 Tax=Gloeobacter kilaueensis (strain ATCC BAA-2537 / CCAP 1431/1 / ULC 316 / JS1) TaxID=1183438 RepID=U5QQE2_GLOK1|nr:alpha-amylase family glycosyl hydrolase [Gloeobacter kilaueensis]AGY59900.1 alpha amylase catalytic region [Gloeobacter kilaueensis JS1]
MISQSQIPPDTDAAKAAAEQEEEFINLLQLSDIEFRGETIYFIVVDRFFNGDPGNDEGPDPSLYDPERRDWGKYWGGDLEGIIAKLDYLQKLGVTAIWVTPLFEQIEAMSWEAAPIHGYWTRDFKRINARWVSGPEEVRLFERNDTTFDRLIKALHERGMKLILDVVCNHSSPDAAGIKGQLFDDGKLIADFNDDKDFWYHHYGEVSDWNDEWQVQNCELAGLATFNENNIHYRNYIKGAIKLWLDKGVDALRVDTVKHMPIWFWQEFNSDIQAHKPDVFVFGEWIYSHPLSERSVEFANFSGMSMLDFGLCIAIRQALAQADPSGFHLIEDVFREDWRYRGATELVTFIDNHDMPRFQSLGADDETLRLAVDLIMLSRGIPCLYYGTEQYLHDDTDGGNDPYNRPMMALWDERTPLFRDLHRLSAVRRRNPAVKWGGQWTRYINPDIYAFVRKYRDARCFVALNRSIETVLVEDVLTELPDGTHRCVLSGEDYTIKAGRLEKLELAPRQVVVLSVTGKPVRGRQVARIQLNGIRTRPGEIVAIVGDCPELGNWDRDQAVALEYINENTWLGEVAIKQSADKIISYKYVVLREQGQPIYENRTSRRRFAPNGTIAKWRDIWEE